MKTIKIFEFSFRSRDNVGIVQIRSAINSLFDLNSAVNTAAIMFIKHVYHWCVIQVLKYLPVFQTYQTAFFLKTILLFECGLSVQFDSMVFNF